MGEDNKSARIGDREDTIKQALNNEVVRELVDKFPEIEKSLETNNWSPENLGVLFSLINFFGIDSIPDAHSIKPEKIPEYVRRIKDEVIRHKDW